MSTESANAVIERIKSDEAFASEVAAAPDADARYALINAAGFDVSAADKDVLVKGLETGELSDAQLEGASGAGSIGISVPGLGSFGIGW